MPLLHTHESRDFIRALSKGYAALILAAFSLIPSFVIAYLSFFQAPGLRFEDHTFHEIVTGVALLQGGFISYITWRCYLHSGEPFLRWLTLAFLGFTLVYGLHGALTGSAHDHPWLFLLYGPAARLTMSSCLLAGLMTYGRPAIAIEKRTRGNFWLFWLGVFALIDILVFVVASSAWASWARIVMEAAALCVALICGAVILARRTRSPLMAIYVVSVLFFAQSSLSFLLARAWNHQWWLAHVIFASGFMALSYGVIQAFLTTRSFSTVYSQAELMEQVRSEKLRAEDALLELQRAHKDLEVLASIDPLTGAANRREFLARSEEEIARAVRSRAPLAMLVADLDHFKRINDSHGHQAGDKVLETFVAIAKEALRPSDFIGRIGGEEFALLLPDATREAAGIVAERLRSMVENRVITIGNTPLRFTASFGVAQYGPDGSTYESIAEAADNRMYRAKREGRYRVIVQ